ncbi:hypothetical protein QOZ80_6AG0539000 [Eleusine coracana subsp. coracana]|nr:hypothetical protein QOZ80_6AG0539000 [Eleusine coracana subsp. coracana]
MSGTPAGNDVRVAGRFVQWDVVLGPGDGDQRSKPFTLGTLAWELSVIRRNGNICLWLTSPPPPDSRIERIASVSYDIVHFKKDKPTVTSHPKTEIPLDGGPKRGCLWGKCQFFYERFSIEIKFIDIKVQNIPGSPPTFIWPSYRTKTGWQTDAQSSFARMLNEGNLSDILVNADGGTGGDSIRAHRAVLAARSPVFMSMFSHDLKEKEQSVVDIPDMSLDACRAFIRYIYGSLSCEEFLAHRSELLAAGDKYDVSGLKETCERSMVEDIDTDSVLERLQIAHLFGLSELKRVCISLLVEFKKMSVVHDDFSAFLETGDEDLVAEVMQSYKRNDFNV